MPVGEVLTANLSDFSPWDSIVPLEMPFFFFQVSPALGTSQRNVSELWCRPYLHELSVAMAATRSWCEETTPFPELCSACGEGPGWMFLSSILTGGLVCTDIGVGN